MATKKSALLVKGLSDKHKDFLHRYAQDKLGTTSRTKAIIDLIEQQMMLEEENKSSLSEMQKVAVEEKKKYIEHHQNLIKQRQKEVLKKSNYELFKLGINVNQFAKANNTGDMIELPIQQLYGFI